MSTAPARWASLSLLAALAAVVVLAGCLVDGRCLRDDDCPSGQFCETAAGACELKACEADHDCPTAAVCSHYRCSATGVPLPAFALVDRNPTSPTFGQKLDNESFRGEVLLIYFANAT